MKTRNVTMIVLTALTLVLSALAARAEDAPMHNPYTVLGVRLRGELLEHPADGSSPMSMGMIEFQEIIPCRFISTVEADHYPSQWGGPAFSPNESRTYHPSGAMVYGNWTNPCSEQVPADAVAVAARIYADSVSGNGVIWLTPGVTGPYDKLSKVAMRDNERTMAEATIVLRDYAFTVTSQTAGAHLRVDIIGFFIRDPWGRGEKGDKGDRGYQGEKGDTGEKGEKGDTGAQGAQGYQGEKGEKGDAGAQGPKGDKGDTGAQGLQGEKGDTGAQGLKGDKGDRGEQGLKGDKGDTGAQGLKGDKGDRGEQGAQGAKGDRGETGAKGDKGDKGATGDRGAQGEKGATGAQGPMGLQGPAGKDGKDGLNGGITMASGSATFPPPGNITIYNGAAKANSVIMLVYKDVSNGNALAVVSQSNGVFTCSGSPNKPFRYVILNYPE